MRWNQRTGWRLAAAGVLVLATVAVYRNCLDVPFVFDDGPAVLNNPTIRRLWPLSESLSPPAGAAGATGRPLVNLSLALNYAWGGLEARGYHAANVALHALAVLVLWGVLRWTLCRPVPGGPAGAVPFDSATAESVAFCTALLWAVHPLLTESVVCVVQRSEAMGGLFFVLTLYGFIRSAHSVADDESRGATRRRAWQAVAVGSCLLGVASKEIVATAPLVVLLYDRTFVAGGFREAWRRRWPFHLALASTWLLLGWLMAESNQRAGTVGLGLGVGSWDYLLTQCRALAIYLKLSFWPDPLVVDYGMGLVGSLRQVWLQGLLVVALLLATVWGLWRRPVLGFAGAWFFVILAPSSSFIPLVTQTMAEHRMYLPLAAVLALVVGFLHRAVGRKSGLLCAVLAVGAGWLTHQRNEVYRDEHRLWSELTALHPGNPRNHVNLAYYFARKGDWAGSIRHNSEAVRLLPEYADAHSGLGLAYEQTGRPAEALAEFELAYRAWPDDPLINYNYGSALARAGRLAEGIARLEASLRLQPGQVDVHNNLGLALAQFGRPAEAMEQFRAGLGLDPGHAELRGNLANALLTSGRLNEAVEEYTRVLEQHPDFAAVRQNLAAALIRLGRTEDAIAQYEQALVRLPGSAQLHHRYALALEETGRVAEAIAQEEEAIRLDPGLTAARENLARLRARWTRGRGF